MEDGPTRRNHLSEKIHLFTYSFHFATIRSRRCAPSTDGTKCLEERENVFRFVFAALTLQKFSNARAGRRNGEWLRSQLPFCISWWFARVRVTLHTKKMNSIPHCVLSKRHKIYGEWIIDFESLLEQLWSEAKHSRVCASKRPSRLDQLQVREFLWYFT